MKKKQILGVGISDAKMDEALEFIVTGLQEKRKKLSIFTPNPEIIVAAQRNKTFKNILNEADLALADGVGVLWAGNLLEKPLKARITGVDFMLALSREAAKRGFTVGLMGGGPKIAERTAECLLRKYPKLRIGFVNSEWPQKDDRRLKMEDSTSIYYLPSSIDILFVALGFPKQEQWIHENLPKIPVQCAMAVGGSFDYTSGAVPRAPLLIRQIGLEWLFRLLIQPWRIRRQLALIKFLFLVFKEKFSPSSLSSRPSR